MEQIVLLKKQHWDYTVEDQLRWIESNIQPQDIHLLIYGESRLMAYLNLVHRTVLNAVEKHVLGVGNVCVDKAFRRTGLGAVLMWSANWYLKTHHTVGMLLCKAPLCRFYESVAWEKFEQKACDKQGNVLNENIHLYVYNGAFSTIKLLGDVF
ncbi:MAG: hypothetical protein LBR10_16205 [Prevotellaceae bacterium]|jgi:predicted GNAT family N-acyltransferase|nr:hypothetical protein [Prevotellaceae bacterium]